MSVTPTVPLPTFVLLALALSLALALGASLFVFGRYRRRIRQAMRASDPAGQGPRGLTDPPVAHAGRLEVADAAPPARDASIAKERYARAVQGARLAALVYAVAGAAASTTLGLLYVAGSGGGFAFRRVAITIVVFLWPLVATTVVILGLTGRRLLGALAVYAVVGAVVAGPVNWLALTLLWLILMGPPSIVLLSLANRRIGAVGPFLLATAFPAVLGLLLATWTGLVRFAFSDDRQGYLAGLEALGIAAPFLIVAFAFLPWTASRYRRKAASDQALLLDTWWLTVVAFSALDLLFESWRYAIVAMLSFFVYRIVLRIGWRLLRRRSESHPNTRLLLLRVFGSQRRSESLLAGPALYWRYLGSVQLIGGTDLATATLEPHEFLDFLLRRTQRHVVASPEDIEEQMAGIDPLPDPDGRYRVNTLYCSNDTWTMVLRRLVPTSDVVLLDLRGFTRDSRGVAYELEALLETLPSSRAVLTVDATTDVHWLQEVMGGISERLSRTSPNWPLSSDPLRVLRLSGQTGRDARRSLQALAAASSEVNVATPAPAQPQGSTWRWGGLLWPIAVVACIGLAFALTGGPGRIAETRPPGGSAQTEFALLQNLGSAGFAGTVLLSLDDELVAELVVNPEGAQAPQWYAAPGQGAYAYRLEIAGAFRQPDGSLSPFMAQGEGVVEIVDGAAYEVGYTLDGRAALVRL